MGLLSRGKSAGSSVYSHSSSNYTISDGNLYLLHMENSPRFYFRFAALIAIGFIFLFSIRNNWMEGKST